DGHVTGVQTCALPIYFEFGIHRARPGRIAQLLREILYADDAVSIGDRSPDLDAVLSSSEEDAGPLPHGNAASYVRSPQYDLRTRSEERRVGKEGRYRW